MKHPSDLALEQHLQDRALHREHIDGCARCQARLSAMEAEGQHFNQFVFPATLEKLEQAPRRRFSPLLLLAPLAAVAAVLVVVVQRPGADYVGTKGAALKLTIYAAGPSGARALSDKDIVPATAALRFRVQASAPCTLAILSVDDKGEVSRIAGPLGVSGDSTLPGGAVLDGRAGQERFFAVCSPAPVPDLEQRVRAAGVGGSAPLSGLPAGSTQASLLLDKRP